LNLLEHMQILSNSRRKGQNTEGLINQPRLILAKFREIENELSADICRYFGRYMAKSSKNW
jgi:hypothetical protein